MIIRAPRDSSDLSDLHSLLEQYDISAHYRAEPAAVRAELMSRVRNRTLQAVMAFTDEGIPVGFLLFFFNHLQLECVFCDAFVVRAQRGGKIGPELIKTVKEICLASGLTHGRWSNEHDGRVFKRLFSGEVTETIDYIWRME